MVVVILPAESPGHFFFQQISPLPFRNWMWVSGLSFPFFFPLFFFFQLCRWWHCYNCNNSCLSVTNNQTLQRRRWRCWWTQARLSVYRAVSKGRAAGEHSQQIPVCPLAGAALVLCHTVLTKLLMVFHAPLNLPSYICWVWIKKKIW